MVNPQWEAFQRPKEKEIIEQPEIQKIPQKDLQQPEKEFKEELPGEIEDDITPEGEKPQWGNFKSPDTYQGEIDPTQEESTFGYFARNINANASRLAEQFFGARGNAEKMGKEILNSYPQTGGILGMALSELMGPEGWERLVKGPKDSQQILPTSEQLKEFSQKATAGYTKPKTPGEEKFQGYVEDIGSTLNGRRIPTFRNIAVNNLGIPIASNLVKNTIKDLGFGEDKATIAKLGTWTALSLLGNVNVNQYAADLMNRGRNGIPQNVLIDVPRLQQRLRDLYNDPTLLHADPRSSLARQEIANIERDLANGQTSVRSLMTTYDGVNAAKRDAGLFGMNAGDQRFARRAIDRVRDVVRAEIEEAGGAFPEALDQWGSGIRAWAVIHQSNSLTQRISQLAKGPYAKILTGPALGLFGVSAKGAVTAPLIAGPAALGVPAAYKSIQTAYRVWNDPNLSRYYWGAISDAQRENIPGFINNYNKLNKSLEKSISTTEKAKSKKK